MRSLYNCTTIALAVLVAVVILSQNGLGKVIRVYKFKSPCKTCSGEECNPKPLQVCTYGEYIDRCNRTMCSKGPGQKCGERLNGFGICGEGMWCCSKDNLCHGCYIPLMECYPEDD